MKDGILFALKLVALCAFILVCVEAMIYLPRMAPIAANDASQSFTRAEFITIVLSAVTAVLSALMIMLAVLAFWGYTSLRTEARNAAEQTATKVAKEVALSVAAREARAAVTQVSGADYDEQPGIPEAFVRDDIQ